MTSLINPSNIDITFPIAGQDNDTQGFRTNYQNIRNNFTIASNEITALQSNVSILQTEIVTGNITVSGNVVTGNITSPAGTNGNITIDPDGAGDVVFPATTEVYVNSTSSTALNVRGGVGVAGDLNLAGNLIIAGTRIDGGYQYYAPTTNFTYTVNNNVYRFILDPSGAITNGNVLLPSANIDATIVSISSTQTVTNFKVTPNNGTTLVPSANVTLTGGTSVEYFYHASEAKWYKVR
jgi:hypothetical protein